MVAVLALLHGVMTQSFGMSNAPLQYNRNNHIDGGDFCWRGRTNDTPVVRSMVAAGRTGAARTKVITAHSSSQTAAISSTATSIHPSPTRTETRRRRGIAPSHHHQTLSSQEDQGEAAEDADDDRGISVRL